MIRDIVGKYVADEDGILSVHPAWVAKNFLHSGKRMGLPDAAYDQGERGEISERWLCSVTDHDSPFHVKNDGLSFLAIPHQDITLRDAIDACPEIVGRGYYQRHHGLDRLIKLFDYEERLPFHIHQRQEDLNTQAKHSKDESYHFLDAPTGPHPETFIGVHPYIVKNHLQEKLFLPILKEWKAGDAEVLRYSTAYYCTPGEGFFLKSGILHAPGSVLTFELQESSDVCGFFQPKVGNYQMDKRMLFKDVAPEEIEKWGPEKAALRQVDWQANTDPNFYDKYHLFPRKCTQTEQHGLFETWIFYGTPKFSGKRLILPPHTTFHCVERGVHNLFCWKGEATVGGKRMKAGCVDLQSCEDELLVCDERARKGYDIVNVGDGELCIYKIFGPELNDDIVPAISQTGT